MKIRKKQMVLFVLLFLLVLGIFAFSAQTGEKSAEFSENLTEKFLNFFGKTDLDFENAERFLRKTAHFFEFFILGAVLFLLFSSFRRNVRISALFSFGLSFLYAAADECHQIFVPDRGPSFGDVLLDGCGAACGILFALFIRFLFQKKKR